MRGPSGGALAGVFFVPRGIALEGDAPRPGGERGQGSGVVGEHLLGFAGRRLVVFLLVEPDLRQEHAGGLEGGVHLEASLQHLQHPGGAVRIEHPGHGQEGSRVRRVAVQRFLRRRACVRAVVLLEEELHEAHARVDVVGIGGDGLVEGLQRVLEELGIVRAEGPAGPCHRRELLGGERRRLVVGVDEPVEAAHGFLALAPGEAEAGEVHFRGQRIRGTAGDGLLEGGLRFRAAATRGQDPSQRVEELG